ncbi:hypothetical protein PPERSA_07324 [Pseudocohnilembus persalinus]|uniref:C2HC/C3H-type domain-containing protein n=1 Tax=Pseudocohnilembus persalinus TaxID=266149 RepID=A0A0V0R6W7_PSEPJ|nr:hypothetical protein PPERSA_07324 [Pseudocohnilembus persalinus]|eukprot:KRX10239.1 hypothetical protein PPERSA_07324 [Pseudocohnilembus persalinus]
MNRPKSVVCYICGREYGTHSINIHQNQCKVKWEKEQLLKPKNERRPLPQPPKELELPNSKGMTPEELEKYNNQATQQYNDVSLVPCQNCGRTFREEALKHHIKGCSASKPFKAGNEKTTNHVPCALCKQKFALERLEKHEQTCKGPSSSQQQQQKTPQKTGFQGNGSGSGSGVKTFSKPKALMCYICGREYGTKSLGIHLKTCVQKFEIEQSKKPKSERKQVPQQPPGLMELLSQENITQKDIDDYNSGAYDKYNTEGLDPCPNCGRTFTAEALKHHINACKADKPFESGNLKPCSKCGRKFVGDRVAKHESVCKGDGNFSGQKNQNNSSIKSSPQKQKLSSNEPKQIVRPKTLVCHICGREYGTTSLKIHIPQCEKKWENEQAKLPKNQRKPLPQPPKEINLKGATSEQIEQFNNQALDQYNNQALDKCPHCQRTFTSTAMKHHQKACTAEKPMKSVNKNNLNLDEQKIGGAGQQQQNQDMGEEVVKQVNLQPCGKCGRKFLADRLPKHESVCKGK